MRAHRCLRVSAAAIVSVALLVLAVGIWAVPSGATTYASVNGQGSTYAALAFQTWTQSLQQQGLRVNYTATGSPAGLAAYTQNTADFAGTEAEYSELYADTVGTANAHVARGFAYTPDAAGAISIMYHVALTATGKTAVTYLHLSPLTIAKIFLGIITNWDSPTITNDNKGLKLPSEPITIDYRSGQSGTTALFFDFVRHEDPSDFHAWALHCGYNPTIRVWEIDDCLNGLGYARTVSQAGSDQQAQFIASHTGQWSIGYDEFGYAKVYHDDVAWVKNASGAYVQPYALNIAAALQSAVLAPDTSQTLQGVYASTNPLAYPISAYSYILYQCAPTPARPTCKTPYASAGIANTMSRFMRYIACTGQRTMAAIGYSPLPTQLSQFLANAIGYMTGQPPETLTVGNCSNPQFQGGNLGVGALPPPDPTAGVASLAPGGGGGSASAGSAGASTDGGAASSSSTGGSHATAAGTKASGSASTAAGYAGATGAAGVTGLAGSQTTGSSAAALGLSPDPVAYVVPMPGGGSPWPFLVLLLLLVIPVALLTVRHRRAVATTADTDGEVADGGQTAPPGGWPSHMPSADQGIGTPITKTPPDERRRSWR